MLHHENLIFRQLFDKETSTYTYLLADAALREGILIDPVLEQKNRDINLIEELGLKIKYVLDTHVHADHITGASAIRNQLHSKYVVGAGSALECADILIKDGDSLNFGSFQIDALATPGHTDSCMSFYIDNMVFTGDTLLVRGCGRTDFQQGSVEKLYNSIHQKIYNLPPNTLVYPAHDYHGVSCSTVSEEEKWNPRISVDQNLEGFKKIMDELKLEQPKFIDVAIPANLKCGLT